MKKVLTIIGVTVVIIAAAILVFLASLGYFRKVEVVERRTGPYSYVYREFKGPYMNTKTVFDEVYKIVKAEGCNPEKGIGIYFDDPAKVPAAELRSKCGCIIEGADLAKLPVLKEKLAFDELKEADSLVVEFPIKNAMSYMIGPMKAYPAISKAALEKKYKFTDVGVEIYDEPAKKIYFIFQYFR
ncbi:MAG: hypothetical protein A2096_08290 [Spirochaetes bacterium GWF1_41_5]|nr:MAG: hypothetical protein A2096_08290 [Spirochaetes bacterium GWF1_41_5]HBE01926.1 hypothetical protein [Spirochaetia bacterium]